MAFKMPDEEEQRRLRELNRPHAPQRPGTGAESPEDQADSDRPATSWAPVDLTDAADGVDVPAPAILARTDDVNLLYRGRVHWVQGEPESLKSWLLLLAAAQVLLAGGCVLWIDFEDDDRGVVSRLMALGVSRDVILSDRLVYVRPDEPLQGHRRAVTPAWLDFDVLLKRSWDLAVIDGVTEAMTTEGLSLLDNSDIAQWQRLLPKRIATETGAAVVVIDHVTKSKEAQGRWAIGGQHKLAGVTGATYKVTNTRKLSRATDKPITGSSTVTVEKDRPGWVRGNSDGGVIAVLELTAYPDGGITGRLLPPDQATTMPEWTLLRELLLYLQTYEGASKNAIEKEIGGNATALREALKWMIGKQWIEVRKDGQAHRHYLLQAGRDAMEKES